MHYQIPAPMLSKLFLAAVGSTLIVGCASRLGPAMESTRVARELGLSGCGVSKPMRRYQALDLADLSGNPNLADSPDWEKALSMMQPGDELRHVYCESNGDNYFGLFRGTSIILRFGRMISD